MSVPITVELLQLLTLLPSTSWRFSTKRWFSLNFYCISCILLLHSAVVQYCKRCYTISLRLWLNFRRFTVITQFSTTKSLWAAEHRWRRPEVMQDFSCWEVFVQPVRATCDVPRDSAPLWTRHHSVHTRMVAALHDLSGASTTQHISWLSLTHLHLSYTFLLASSLYVIGRPYVCLSVVCNVRAPYSGEWNFQQYFYAMWYLGHPWPLYKKFTEIVPGEPSVGGVKHKRGSRI